MGSVPVLTTSGDNDPEIEPVQSFRHYLYCDSCGSFDLSLWESGDRTALEWLRARLASVALYATSLIAVPVWRMTGSALPLWLFALVAMGIGLQQVLKSLPFEPLRRSGWVGASWRLALRAALWSVHLALAEALSRVLPPAWVATIGGVIVAGALVLRAGVAPRVRTLGLQCRQCGATYAFGTPFFADIDANPRGLTEADLPGPLWRLEYVAGRYVGPAPAAAARRLP